MSTQVTTAFVQQYSANVQMLSQQRGSLLRDTVRSETMVGKNAFLTKWVKPQRSSVLHGMGIRPRSIHLMQGGV